MTINSQNKISWSELLRINNFVRIDNKQQLQLSLMVMRKIFILHVFTKMRSLLMSDQYSWALGLSCSLLLHGALLMLLDIIWERFGPNKTTTYEYVKLWDLRIAIFVQQTNPLRNNQRTNPKKIDRKVILIVCVNN